MSDFQRIIVYLSEEGLKLVQEGKAKLSSGGIRNAAGELIEQYKILKDDNSFDKFNEVAEQMKKLNGNLVNCQNLIKSMSELSSIIQGCNMIIGLADCAISVAGFAMVLNKLDSIGMQIVDLSKQIAGDKLQNEIRDFHKYLGYVKTDIGIIRDMQQLSDASAGIIGGHLSEINAYLESLIDEMLSGSSNTAVLMQLIYGLSEAYIEDMRIFTAIYYYKTGKMPAVCESLGEAILKLNSTKFQNQLKMLMAINPSFYDISIEDRTLAYNIATTSLKKAINDYEYDKELIQMIDEDQYFNIDKILEEKIKASDYIVKDNQIELTLKA